MYNIVQNHITLNDEPITRMTLVGLAAESFLRLAICSRLGFHCLRSGMVKHVDVRCCFVDGRKIASAIQISVDESTSDLAMRVARQLAEDMEASGYRLLDAVRPQFDRNRAKVGEHDIVAERRKQCIGYSSLDLKCRVITHPKTTLETFREQLRKDVALKSKLWHTCCLKPSPKQPGQDAQCGFPFWAERLVYMVQFSSAGAQSWSKTRCEAIANSPRAEWTNIFGWDDVAFSSIASEPPPPVRPTQSKASAKKRSAPATRKLDDIWASEAVRKKSRRGKTYASVSDLCREMNTGDATRKKKHLDEWMPKWASKQDWADSSWQHFAEFGSSVGGGNRGVGAIKSVCIDIYNMCNKPQSLLDVGVTATIKHCIVPCWARKGGACSGARTHESRDWSGIGSGIGPGLVRPSARPPV